MRKEKIYKEIAKKYGVNVDEVKREMQAAIDEAYANPNPAVLDIPRKASVPTVDEFVDFAVEQVNNERQ